MVEVLEKAFEFYNKREQEINKLNTYQQTIQAIERQMQNFQGKMNAKELESRTNKLTPELFNKIDLVMTYRILRGTLEECLRCWKETIV